MSEGRIPTSASDLPIETVVLDDSLTYKVELEKVTLSPKTDKNGRVYCAIQVAVTDGDYEGMRVQRNYLPLPIYVDADASKRDRIQAQNISAAFGRFCKSFGIKGNVAYVDALNNEDQVSAFAEWMSNNIGNHGRVSVENSEFPLGSGKMRSAINDFVF